MQRSREPQGGGAIHGKQIIRRRTILRLVVAGVLSLGLLVGVAAAGAELVLRSSPDLMPEEAQIKAYWQALDRMKPSRRDPELGFVYPPHFSARPRYHDFGFSYTTDEHGFRNPSPWPAQADVVVLGDSQAFGYGVEAAESWSQLVADGLPDSETINLGMNGAAPQQYARVFDAFGAALRPKVVLMSLYPAYALSAVDQFDRWLAAGRPGNYDRWRTGGRPSDWWGSLKELVANSYVWRTLSAIIAEWRTGEDGQTLTLADGSELKLVPSLYVHVAEHARAGDPSFEHVLAIVEKIRMRARQSGAGLVVVLIPAKEEVYLPLLGTAAPPFTASFAAALAARGVPVIDTTPRLRARVKGGEALFFPLDVHPNLAGQRLIADLVLDELRRRADGLGMAAAAKPR